MRLTMATIVFLYVLPISTVSGQGMDVPIGHLKKPTPDVLAFAVLPMGCPGTQVEYTKIVEGELLRARIKPSPQWNFFELTLLAELSCEPSESQLTWIFDLDVSFIVTHPVENPQNDEYSFYRVHYDPIYGTFGVLRNETVINGLKTQLREQVGRLLTDYLKANFDL